MEELSARDWHKQPAAEPPWALSQPSLLIHSIEQEFQTPRRPVDSSRQTELLLSRDRQSEARQTGPDGRGKARRERARDLRIALPEGLRVLGAEVCTESDEEAI